MSHHTAKPSNHIYHVYNNYKYYITIVFIIHSIILTTITLHSYIYDSYYNVKIGDVSIVCAHAERASWLVKIKITIRHNKHTQLCYYKTHINIQNIFWLVLISKIVTWDITNHSKLDFYSSNIKKNVYPSNSQDIVMLSS